MIDKNIGTVMFEEGLCLFRGMTFEDFRQTNYFSNQDSKRVFYLRNLKIFNETFIISLFFKEEILHSVSLIIDDSSIVPEQEVQRKIRHDTILTMFNIEIDSIYEWGQIESNYNSRSNISSIDITYF
ncbi:hypothetical protein [Streptococcus ruminantium]|uniref:hypothetical protein n=1 Tax=Streptococcus ruminantium TaxID=1917441 RepID=UPI0012DEA6FC|nr:hypothetical protein [Streptococcus ruminantium]HEM3635048.1 hypothetical protein [Streptococcus suis]